jgi:hypothetical protein
VTEQPCFEIKSFIGIVVRIHVPVWKKVYQLIQKVEGDWNMPLISNMNLYRKTAGNFDRNPTLDKSAEFGDQCRI